MHTRSLDVGPLSGWRGKAWLSSLMTAAALILGACGSGGGGDMSSANSATGTLLVGLTDADGDFLRYEVNVVSLDLVRADGTIVHTLPNTTRVDFTQYVDLTEFFTAAQVPSGRYVSGSVTVDYTDADIEVEVGGQAVKAVVHDQDGNPIGQTTLDIQLDGGNPLVVRPGLPSLLTVDFDLDASNRVDVTQTPPVVTASPFLAADVEPVVEKNVRLRGPLVSVNTADQTYTARLRPCFRQDGDFGEVVIHVSDTTTYEINGTAYTGNAGLDALAALPQGTATVAFGVLTVADRSFDASMVLAGDSVPGAQHDAVLGNVVARNGNTLTVRGATIMPRNGSAIFNDNVQVLIGPNTGVKKLRAPGEQLDIGAISVGQRVEISGDVVNPTAVPATTLDATNGRVRLLLTHIAGTVNTALPGHLSLDLQSIDGRRPTIFDFAGTGVTPAEDANFMDYEVDTGALNTDFTAGDPARLFGFVRPFGAAPADFEATTVVDLTDHRAALGIGWGLDGTTMPFLSVSDTALVPDLANPDIGARHHIVIGGVVYDLKDLTVAPTIIPATSGPMRFAILQGHRLLEFHRFADFVAALEQLVDGSRPVYGLIAAGDFDRPSGILTANVVGVVVGGMPAGN